MRDGSAGPGSRSASLIAAVLGSAVYLLREAVVGLYTANPVIVAAALPLLAWVALFHVADAAQTIAAFVLRAYRIATVPLVIYVVVDLGHRPRRRLRGGVRPDRHQSGLDARRAAASGRCRRSASRSPAPA